MNTIIFFQVTFSKVYLLFDFPLPILWSFPDQTRSFPDQTRSFPDSTIQIRLQCSRYWHIFKMYRLVASLRSKRGNEHILFLILCHGNGWIFISSYCRSKNFNRHVLRGKKLAKFLAQTFTNDKMTHVLRRINFHE